MVQPWKFFLAVLACIAMLAIIFAMAFIPDNTHQWFTS